MQDELLQSLEHMDREQLLETAQALRVQMIESSEEAALRQARSRDQIISLRTRLRQVRDDRHNLRLEVEELKLELRFARERQIGMLLMGQAVATAQQALGERTVAD